MILTTMNKASNPFESNLKNEVINTEAKKKLIIDILLKL